MKRTTSAGLAMVGGIILLLVVALSVVVRFDRPGLLGAGIGLGLGTLNLAVGLWLAQRALRQGMKSAMTTLMGGFLVRLLALAGLVLAFQRTDAVDEVAFALTFLVLFFVYVALEIVLVERALGRARRAA